MDTTQVTFKAKIMPLKAYAVSGFNIVLCIKLSRTGNRAKRSAIVSFLDLTRRS